MGVTGDAREAGEAAEPAEPLEATILALLADRAPGATICPSEAARAAAAGDDWRALMQPVRDAAAALADRGELQVTQRGRPVDPRAARGPVRLRRPVAPEHQGTPAAWDEHDLHAWQVLAPLQGGYLPWSTAAMRPVGLVAVLNEVALLEPDLVVECGAGISTLFLARLLRQRGRGRLVSLEHDERWADWVRRTLAAEGLEDRTAVALAPLAPSGWYEPGAVDGAVGEGPIGVLLVDGPPACAPELAHARYPALPHFAGRLAPDAVVVVDDAWRAGERDVVRRWEAESDLRFELRPDRGHIAVGRAPGEGPGFRV